MTARWLGVGAAAGAGYLLGRTRRGLRQPLVQIGAPQPAGANGYLRALPQGVDLAKWRQAARGIIGYHIVDPDGALLADPLTGEMVQTAEELRSALAHSRMPIFYSEAVTAAAKVPFSIRGKAVPPLRRVPAPSNGRVKEQEISAAFWARLPPKVRKARPYAATSVLAQVFQAHRAGFIEGSVRKLLGTSVKVEKGLKLETPVETAVMYLSPADEAGINTCAKAGECAIVCLGHSTGQLAFETSKLSRLGKTLYWWFDNPWFLAKMDKELKALSRGAQAKGLRPAARLNGSSDILWEHTGRGKAMGGGLEFVYKPRSSKIVPIQGHPSLIAANPDLDFYDYSKYPLRARSFKINGGPSNYHVIYSLSEQADSLRNADEYLRARGNVAVVVGSPLTDATYQRLKGLNDRVQRLVGKEGSCPMPEQVDEMTGADITAEGLRAQMAEVAHEGGITKNTCKAASFHVLFPGEEYLSHGDAARYPAEWEKWRQEGLKRSGGRFTNELLGWALFQYEKQIYKRWEIPWNESTRQWLLGAGCIDADQTDVRFFDPPQTWGILYAKGPAAWDVGGFVVRVDNDGNPLFLGEREAERQRLEAALRRSGRANLTRRAHKTGRPNYYRHRRTRTEPEFAVLPNGDRFRL